MNRIPKRKKGIAYYYFNGVNMQLTYDMGTTSDIERFKSKNYFDSKNARLFQQSINNLLSTIQ